MMNTRAVALLETALRETTNQNERDNAISALRRAAANAGGLTEYIKSISPQRVVPAAPQPFQTYTEARAEKAKILADNERLIKKVAELEANNAGLERDIARLTTEIKTLKAKNTAMAVSASKKEKVADDGTMPYKAWSEAVANRTGDYARWQMAFEDQTGLPRSRIQSFRLRGTVDADYVEALSMLSPSVPPQRHKEKWTLGEVRRLRVLIDEGKTEKEAATILSGEFGRIFTDNMIKRTKLDSRARKGVFTNPAFGPEIGKSRM